MTKKNTTKSTKSTKTKPKKSSLSPYRLEIGKLAKKVNRKMRTLEKHGLITTPAYTKAQEYLQEIGKNRFSETPSKMTAAELKKEKKILEMFDKAKSSTKTGYLKQVKGRNEKFISKGIKESDLDLLYKTLSSKFYKEMLTALESDQIISNFVKIKESTEDLGELTANDFTELMTLKEKENINKIFNKEIFKVKKKKPIYR